MKEAKRGNNNKFEAFWIEECGNGVPVRHASNSVWVSQKALRSMRAQVSGLNNLHRDTYSAQ